jgi:Cu(I)/Ag(I) efflux system membrane fusion protein
LVPVGTEPREVEGEIAFVAPTVDPTTRTVKVRLDVANDDGALRPGAYGTILVDVEQQPAVVVPTDAVIDTGVRTLVFVAWGAGHFEPRVVKLGVRVAGSVQVLEGLKEGEAVVTRAQFLLDSESRIRGAGGVSGHEGH